MDEIKLDLKEAQQQNLQRAIDFLKFAEAKNAAAVAFSSTLLLAVFQLRSGVSNLNTLEIAAMVLCLLGGLVAVRSFVPQLDPRIFFSRGEKTQTSLIYFGDIAKLSVVEFETQFSERYQNTDNLVKDMAKQCSIMSKIAVDKMNHFTWSLFLTFFGAAFLVISLTIEVFLMIGVI